MAYSALASTFVLFNILPYLLHDENTIKNTKTAEIKPFPEFTAAKIEIYRWGARGSLLIVSETNVWFNQSSTESNQSSIWFNQSGTEPNECSTEFKQSSTESNQPSTWFNQSITWLNQSSTESNQCSIWFNQSCIGFRYNLLN